VKVVVAGAGIGGLATAIAIRRAGHEVEVLERALLLEEVGAGLAIWPNGHRALAALGMQDVPGISVPGVQVRTWRGRLLIETPVGEFRARYGHDLLLVHRAELHSSLVEMLGRESVRPASEVVAFEQDESRVAISLASGTRLEADLLVGADGLRSVVRRSLLDDGEPRFSGATCWRGVARFEVEGGCGVNWLGRAAEFGIFPIRDGRAYWFAVRNRREREADGPSGRKADVIDAFEGWPEAVAAVVQATPDADVLRNDLYDRPEVTTWTQGRVTLVGDAAHPMLPNLGQGACQALEDAVVLGTALATLPRVQALQAYEAQRLKRANGFVAQSRLNGRLARSNNPVLLTLRNFAAAHLPRALVLRQLDGTMGKRTSVAERGRL
jgi:2-polyprenyl-6-methoxyphenol hydroxylase-like FAD-dependent oxidoreductase